MPKQRVEGTRSGGRERERRGAPERVRGVQAEPEEGLGQESLQGERRFWFLFFSSCRKKKKEKEEKHESGRAAFSFFFFSFFFLPGGGEKKKRSTRKTIQMEEKIKHDTKIKATWRERECPVSAGLSRQEGYPTPPPPTASLYPTSLAETGKTGV